MVRVTLRFKEAAILGALACSFVLVSIAVAYPTIYPTGVTINEPGVSVGYFFVPNHTKVHLLEPDGTVAHTWHPRPLDNGNILVKTTVSDGVYAVVELDWDSNVVWYFAQPPDGYPPETEFHHDWTRLPNGNTLILARNQTSYPNISNKTIMDDFIIEVSPTGEIEWEWHTPDHFDEFGFSQERKDTIYEFGGDWSHVNAIAPIPENTSHSDPRFMPGNIVISLRYHGIGVIDRGTDQIVWFNGDETVGQHDANMIPGDRPGGGNILAFDNGWAWRWAMDHNRNYSRVVEIDPVDNTVPYVYDAESSGLHKTTFFSSYVSGAERQLNGNTLICEGASGRAFEITPDGTIVWEYIHPWKNPQDFNSNTLYRAYKVPLSQFSPDLVVSGSEDWDPVPGGSSLNYTIQVVNSGSDPAVDVRLDQATPVGTTYQSISEPVGWSCTTPGVGGTGPISCTTRSLSVGASASLTLGVAVDPCIDVGTLIDNVATVSSMGGDATPGDNSTVITTEVSDTDCDDGAPTKRQQTEQDYLN
jgi:uncharacterized repeat protein (TIGR01451 family)